MDIKVVCKKWNQKRLKKIADLCGHGLILDIGFASNPNVFLKGKVIGVDVRPCKAPSNYWTTVVASGEALPFVNQIDAICAEEIIEHLENPIKFLVECNQTLKQSGNLILSTPNPYHLVDFLKNILGNVENLYSDTHLYLFPYRLVLKLLDLAGFKVLCCYGNYFKIPGISLNIPMQAFPTISSNITYFSRKLESVRIEEIYPKVLRKVQKFYKDYERRYGKLPSWCD